MTSHARTRRPAPATACIIAVAALVLGVAGGRVEGQEGFRFRSGVELINVTATVTDRSGHFRSGLRQEDFFVYEDGEPVEVTHFSAERVPVSLGIVLDTSGSMAGDKIEAARAAIDRFLEQLLDPEDEVFLYRFGAQPDLVSDWTRDRRSVSEQLRRIQPNGGTAMYDAVADAVQKAHGGVNQKKAVVVISDGNDTNSRLTADEVRHIVRETEVLVYAVGIDGREDTTLTRAPRRAPPIIRPPIPMPFPGGRRRAPGIPQPPPGYPPVISRGSSMDRANVAALREITDDTGGRTEVIRAARDLDPATRAIADELSQQYYLGYPSLGHQDNRWHTIDVRVKDPSLRVRARRGYIAGR